MDWKKYQEVGNPESLSHQYSGDERKERRESDAGAGLCDPGGGTFDGDRKKSGRRSDFERILILIEKFFLHCVLDKILMLAYTNHCN